MGHLPALLAQPRRTAAAPRARGYVSRRMVEHRPEKQPDSAVRRGPVRLRARPCRGPRPGHRLRGHLLSADRGAGVLMAGPGNAPGPGASPPAPAPSPARPPRPVSAADPEAFEGLLNDSA